LERGNSDAAPAHYASLGLIASGHFGDYDAGYRLGKLACGLTEHRGLKRLGGRTYLMFALVVPWTRPVREGIDPTRRAFQMANEQGDPTFAAFALRNRTSILLAAGDPLEQVEREAEDGLEFARTMRFGFAADMISSPLALVRTLRGETAKFGSFDHVAFTERSLEGRLTGRPAFALPECFYWIRKLQARYFASDYASAVEAAEKAERLFSTSASLSIFLLERAEYHLYTALSRAACCEPMGPDPYAEHREALAAHDAQLRAWAANCPENFENRVALVGAEIARIEVRELDAERLYEQAIGSARANGFIHNEALAYELAARFYAARGFKQIADLYLRNARYGYLRWGAVGKVRQLDETYPDLRQEDSSPGPMSTMGAPVEHLDLATVIKVSQAVSSEIVLENLIDTVMRTAMAQAGAGRALLIFPRGKEPRIEAEATTGGDTVTVRLVDEAVTERVLPESVLNYVLRTREIVILDDAAARSPFGVDSYVRQRQARSILCLPLLNQAKLIGALYLENNLAPGVFAPARISVLKLLASQAAIALENAHLYRDVAEREKQQAATSEMLRLISNSPIQSVLDAVAENAARLCDANNVDIFRLEDNLLRLVASYGEIPVVIHAYQGVPVDRNTVTGRAACDRRTIHVHDLASEEGEYPVGSSNAKREGHRTTLGTPLLREGTPVGIILVRRMEVRPFSGQQIALLETFADQAVIAIENARLFKAEQQRTLALAHANRDLAEREAKIRRLVDSNVIGIFIWDFDGRFLEANDEFLRMVGYDREDLLAGSIRWTDLTPPDWRDRNNERMERGKSSGRFETFEKEYTRKDGSRVPVLIGGATFEMGGNQGVAFVLDLTDRKRAEDALRESELKLREIIETVPSMLWSAAADGEPTRVNQRILDYGGIRFEDILSLGWKEFLHPEDFSETARAFYQAIQTGEPYEAVHRLRRADGQYRWHHARAEPLRDKEHRIIQWYGLLVDIDERKKAEDRLRRSEVYLAESQRLSHSGTAAYNETEIFYWSDENYRIFGFDPREGLPSRKAALERIHPGDRERVRKEACKAVEQRQDYALEFRILLPGGSVTYTELKAHPKFSESGELVEVVGTIIDVTERKRAEAALRESEAKFRDYAETASDWFWEIGPDYKFTLLTENAFGSDPAQRIGTSCWDHALDLDTEPEKWRLVFATLDARESFRDFVYCAMDGSGAPMYVKASGKPVFDGNGTFLGYRGTGTDVTAIVRGQRAEASLQTVQAELAHVGRVMTLGQLTASIAHEVNQPIGSARNNARAALNFLDRSPPDLGEVREALGCIVADADRAGGIIDRIRDQIKKVPPRSDPFDLNRAIEEVIGLAQSMMTESEVLVQSRLANGMAHVLGDRVQLQQVVLNLILNAVEAMRSVDADERRLLISTDQSEANGTLVAVRDSGPGIDPKNHEQIFEAFYSTKSGMGMGLSICRSIIAAHGGRLWATAAEPKGALFQFTLPQRKVVNRQSIHDARERH
jgi:PAS domain S-box-containing protein